MSVVFLIFLFILGACFGSFLCCTARRLRHREQGKKPLGSRSVCLSCKHQLAWYDNLPLISWLTLGGRCRYCHAPIGPAEFLSELFSALTFLLLGFTFIPILTATPLASDPLTFAATTNFATLTTSAPAFTIPLLITLFLLVLTLLFLAIYDALYGELPTLALTISIICAIILLTLRVWASFSVASLTLENFILPLLAAILILPGLYYALYKFSRGNWVGDGDWLLALAIALALADPFLALLVLFFANFLACLYALPHLLRLPKKSRKSTTNSAVNPVSTNSISTHSLASNSATPNFSKSTNPLALKLHFGPFLVAAFILVFAFADFFQNLL